MRPGQVVRALLAENRQLEAEVERLHVVDASCVVAALKDHAGAWLQWSGRHDHYKCQCGQLFTGDLVVDQHRGHVADVVLASIRTMAKGN